MAFATSNVHKESAGSLNILVGDWTGSVGDSNGTVVVGGARVYSAWFYDQSSSTPSMMPFPHTVSTSGTLSTVSICYGENVTAGRFIITYK